MATGMLSMALAAAIGAGPYGAYEAAPSYGYDGGVSGYPVYGPSGGGFPDELPALGAYPGNDDLYPYDAQLPWMHGYFQEMPAYGGFVYFRPFNYKHVMPQAQVAGGWGMSPTMPYSQQFWHRYQQEAAMSPQLSSYRSRSPAPRFAETQPRLPASRPPAHVPASYVMPSDLLRNTAGREELSAPAPERASMQRFTRERGD